jgi:hypothetical protein
MTANRLLPLSGVVFVALWVLVILIGGTDVPSTTAPANEIASFYSSETVSQGISSFVIAATVPFLVFFAVSLASLSWPGDAGARSFWRWALLGGSFITGAVIMVMALLHFALVDGADQGISPTALQALNTLDGNTWIAATASLGVMMLGAAGWLLGRARIYDWLGWAALVFGIALFIPFADFVALLLSLVWIIVTSVVLYREPEAERHAAAAPA